MLLPAQRATLWWLSFLSEEILNKNLTETKKIHSTCTCVSSTRWKLFGNSGEDYSIAFPPKKEKQVWITAVAFPATHCWISLNFREKKRTWISQASALCFQNTAWGARFQQEKASSKHLAPSKVGRQAAHLRYLSVSQLRFLWQKPHCSSSSWSKNARDGKFAPKRMKTQIQMVVQNTTGPYGHWGWLVCANTAALSAPQTGYKFWSHTDSQGSGFKHRPAATLLVSNHDLLSCFLHEDLKFYFTELK